MTDALGDLLREFTVRKDGVRRGQSGDLYRLYVFPFTASARDAKGREARVLVTAESAGKVEFVERARP